MRSKTPSIGFEFSSFYNARSRGGPAICGAIGPSNRELSKHNLVGGKRNQSPSQVGGTGTGASIFRMTMRQ